MTRNKSRICCRTSAQAVGAMANGWRETKGKDLVR